MIDFEISPKAKEIVKMVHDFNVNVVRDLSRYYDQYEHEHDELTEDEFKMMRDHHLAVRSKMASDDKPPEGPGLMRVILGEERAWGASSFGGGTSGTGLGNSAINAVATDDQKKALRTSLRRYGHHGTRMRVRYRLHFNHGQTRRGNQ